jgi:hypothetical protein
VRRGAQSQPAPVVVTNLELGVWEFEQAFKQFLNRSAVSGAQRVYQRCAIEHANGFLKQRVARKNHAVRSQDCRGKRAGVKRDFSESHIGIVRCWVSVKRLMPQSPAQPIQKRRIALARARLEA